MDKSSSEKIFLKEMKGFLFYSHSIWPFHRRLVKKIITPRCTNCVISEKLEPLNQEGLCQKCLDLRTQQTAAPKHPKTELSAQLHQILLDSIGKGSRRFDALVLFSGGKDSSYLVHYLLKNYPKLRIVLLTIDNTFMSPFAFKNIESMIQKLDVEHVMIRPPAQVFNKMFRYAFLHLNKKGCSGTVDQFDGDFFHDIARNFAQTNKIPLMISGCSKTQVEEVLGLHHFESPLEFETQKRTQVAGIPLADIFNDEELKLWWQGGEANQIPKVLYPFYAWDFEEQEIQSKVIELGIMPPYSSSPLLTNNQLIPLMAIVDMIFLGYSSFEREFCKMARRGKADPLFWRNIFELSEYSAKTGHFISQTVDQSLKRLNLTRKDLGLPE